MNGSSLTHSSMTAMLTSWLSAIRVLHLAHILEAARLQRRHISLGIVVVLLTSGIGLLHLIISNDVVWGVGSYIVFIASLVGATLGGLLTFLNDSASAALHHRAAQQYGSLRREVEETLHRVCKHEHLQSTEISSIRRTWDAIDAASPIKGRRTFKKAARIVWESTGDKAEWFIS